MRKPRRDPRLSLEQSKRLSAARLLGQGRALSIYLEDCELAKLIWVVLNDVGRLELASGIVNPPRTHETGYYLIPLEWFSESFNLDDFTAFYLECARYIPDFDTFFECLCELHKRRKKYNLILSAQPLPTMLQVAPRALLEFGGVPAPALASWLTWRKWFFDIDNRAAQETGYLFEPVLAAALGGAPCGARNSPIKRANDASRGRQVDCLVGRVAYEFKLRVTIAASGQGRFREELEFARDCRASHFTPILLVLDPTPNDRLTELVAEFEICGGRAYIGDEAWRHLEDEAGVTMATFVEKYVRGPIAALGNPTTDLLDLVIRSEQDRALFKIELTKGDKQFGWAISRREDEAVVEIDETE
jgi:hypothetical protein